MKFLFVTSANLASNPRLTKELYLAKSQGHECTVIQFFEGNWSDSKTESLVKGDFKEVNFITLDSTRGEFKLWFTSSVFEKLLRYIHPQLLPRMLLSYSISKKSFLINRVLKKLNAEYDWVIAHNPAALYPGALFAKKVNAKLGIDVEDYHPGEIIIKNKAARMKYFMQIVLPKADYCSFASPLIHNAVAQYVSRKISNPITIINGFSDGEFELDAHINDTMKVVWYSQNIDFGRGLELFIDAIQEFQGSVTITLIGNLKKLFYTDYLHCKKYIEIIGPMEQADLHKKLSNYDIGLACDIPLNFNREIALTNKIVAYAQSGAWILATNTKAHRDFLTSYSLHSTIVNYEINEIRRAIELLKNNKSNLFSSREEQFHRGKEFSWENISKPLIQIWK